MCFKTQQIIKGIAGLQKVKDNPQRPKIMEIMNSEKKARMPKQLLLKQHLGTWSFRLDSWLRGREEKV